MYNQVLYSFIDFGFSLFFSQDNFPFGTSTEKEKYSLKQRLVLVIINKQSKNTSYTTSYTLLMKVENKETREK